MQLEVLQELGISGLVQNATRDGAVDVFWVSDASYSTITRSVAAAHVVLPALVSAPMHALGVV